MIAMWPGGPVNTIRDKEIDTMKDVPAFYEIPHIVREANKRAYQLGEKAGKKSGHKMVQAVVDLEQDVTPEALYKLASWSVKQDGEFFSSVPRWLHEPLKGTYQAAFFQGFLQALFTEWGLEVPDSFLESDVFGEYE
jgi:hypothetical protein